MPLSPYRYLIVTENRLILVVYQGNTSIEQIFECLAEISNDPGYNNAFNMLNDLRNANLQYDEKQLSDLVSHMADARKVFVRKNTAFLTHSPQQTVFTTILELPGAGDVGNLRTFSTLDGALRWLAVPVYDFARIAKVLNQFNKP